MKKRVLVVLSVVLFGLLILGIATQRHIIFWEFRNLLDKPSYFLLALALTWGLYLPERKIFLKFHGLLSWSWTKKLGWKNNINTFFMINPLFQAIGFALLFINLPAIVTIEELIFRQGTNNWQEGILRSIVFGLVHFAMGVPVLGLIDSILAGLTLTAFYFVGGLDAAISFHLAIDVVILLPVLIIIFLPKQVIQPSKLKLLRQMTLGESASNEPN